MTLNEPVKNIYLLPFIYLSIPFIVASSLNLSYLQFFILLIAIAFFFPFRFFLLKRFPVLQKIEAPFPYYALFSIESTILLTALFILAEIFLDSVILIIIAGVAFGVIVFLISKIVKDDTRIPGITGYIFIAFLFTVGLYTLYSSYLFSIGYLHGLPSKNHYTVLDKVRFTNYFDRIYFHKNGNSVIVFSKDYAHYTQEISENSKNWHPGLRRETTPGGRFTRYFKDFSEEEYEFRQIKINKNSETLTHVSTNELEEEEILLTTLEEELIINENIIKSQKNSNLKAGPFKNLVVYEKEKKVLFAYRVSNYVYLCVLDELI